MPLSQLCSMHELDGHRFCRYHELGQYIFGAPCRLTAQAVVAIS